MMSKKHYEAFASHLKITRPDPDDKMVVDVAFRHQWKRDVIAVSDVCRLDNPRFDAARFFEACGLELSIQE